MADPFVCLYTAAISSCLRKKEATLTAPRVLKYWLNAGSVQIKHTQKVRNKAWLFRPVGRVLINSSVVRIFPVVVPGAWHRAKCPSVGQQVWVLGRASRSQHGQVLDAGETHLGSTELSGSFNNP